MKWQANPDLDPREVWRIIGLYGAPTILELKTLLSTDSASIRMACGKLMAKNRIMPVPHGKAICWVKVTGQKGAPSVSKLRAEAKLHVSTAKKKRSAVTPPDDSNRSTDEDMFDEPDWAKGVRQEVEERDRHGGGSLFPNG